MVSVADSCQREESTLVAQFVRRPRPRPRLLYEEVQPTRIRWRCKSFEIFKGGLGINVLKAVASRSHRIASRPCTTSPRRTRRQRQGTKWVSLRPAESSTRRRTWTLSTSLLPRE